MSELKPCPFCGEQVFPPLASSFDDSYTRCGFCGAKMQRSRWQTRPIEDELRKRIAELEAAQRWHVVADGDLPNTYKPVLTADMSEATRIPVPAFYNLDTKCWSTHFKYDLWVTHWMPLPEPPIVYGKVCEE